MTAINCPDCSRPLNPQATACSCGWGARKHQTEYKPSEAPPPRFACINPGCGFDAKYRKDMGLGLVNVCEPHYEQWFQEQVEQRAVDKGLLTAEQCREWLRVNAYKPKQVTA